MTSTMPVPQAERPVRTRIAPLWHTLLLVAIPLVKIALSGHGILFNA